MKPKPSRVIRVGLTPAEYVRLQRLSETTGIPIPRLVADAVREQHFKKAAA